MLETFDRKIQEAADASTPTAQKYLLGSRLLGQVAQEQQATFRLMAALGEQLQGLRALRDESQKLARSLEDRQGSADQFFRQNNQVIGAMATNGLATAGAVGPAGGGPHEGPAARLAEDPPGSSARPATSTP